MAYQTINPNDGKVSQVFKEMTDSELEVALKTSTLCFEKWQNTSFNERSKITSLAASLMRVNKNNYAKLVTLEMGKLFSEAQAEVSLSADIIDYYSKNAEFFLETVQLKTNSGLAEVQSKPIGILLGVQPWNFPYYQLARFAAPNIMAGNVVIIKHAGCVPQCALAFEKLWLDAGAPKGLYTNLFVSYDQINRLIDDPRVKGVALTGSVEAGKSVAARAGQNLKKSTMELGGADAFIVLADADLEKTIQWALWAKMNNTGQCCIAAKRFIVVEEIADRFLEKLKKGMSELKPGDPMNLATTLGPLSSESALAKITEQVKTAVSAGAQLILGGERIDRPGFFMQATILSDIDQNNPAYTEEIFGPVALFFKVKNEEEAIQLANDSEFGLGGSLFTKDVERGKKIASRINTGMIFINHPTWTSPELPFGGIKNSGYGRELSSLGIQEFMNKKLIRLQSIEAEI